MSKNRNRQNAGTPAPLAEQLSSVLEQDANENPDSILTPEEIEALKASNGIESGDDTPPDDEGGEFPEGEDTTPAKDEGVSDTPSDRPPVSEQSDTSGIAGADQDNAESPSSEEGEAGDSPETPPASAGAPEAKDPADDDKEQVSEESVDKDVDDIDIPEFEPPVIEDFPEDDAPTAKPVKEDELRARLKGVLPDDALLAWDYKSLLLFDQTGAIPLRTPRGEWPVDIRRRRVIKDWSSNALMDWVDGAIKTPRGIDEHDIYEELARRNRLPGNWSHEQIHTYVKEGTRPAYTDKGVLVDDVMRASNPLSHWTHLEIRSALLEEIESPHSKEDLVDALRMRLGLNNTYSAKRLLDTLADSPTEANMNNSLLKSKLEEFKEVMKKPKMHLSDETAGNAQTALGKTLRKLLQRDPAEFTEGWQIVLNFVNENYSTLFTPEIRYRGWSQLALNKPQAATYEDLLTLIIATRTPATRRNPSTPVVLETVLRHVADEQSRSNVMNFYASEQY